jgi:tetratricopeptide (TPR) repeat protein
LLEQHLATWPQAATANQARLWLAGQQQTRRDWRPAFENYANIDPTSRLFVSAIPRAAYCAQRILDETPAAELGKMATQFTNRLQAILNSTNPATGPFYEALLALADIGMRYGTMDPAQLVEPFESMVASADPEVQQGKGRAWLLVVSTADSAKSTAAAKLLEEIGQDKRLLAIAERGLAAIVKQQTGDAAERAKQLRLQVTDAALSLSPEKRDLTFWLFRKSESLADLQQYEQALSLLTELQKEFPKNAGIQLRIARLLTRVYGNQEPAKPLAKWRRLAGQLKPHTPNWYEAKFQVASLLERSGKKQEARKLLEYLKAVPPGWDQSHLKEEFDRLLAKCK